MKNGSAKLIDLYSKLKNIVRKYPAVSIIDRISFELTKTRGERNLGGMPEHGLLLILRVTVEYGNYGDSKSGRKMSEENFRDIVNIWHSMLEHVKMPDEYESVQLWFRITAYQQFWLQNDVNRSDLARIFVLFRNESTHTFNLIFQGQYEMNVDTFLDYILYLSVFLIVENKRVITREWFQAVDALHPPKSTEKFFGLISGHFYEHQKRLRKLEPTSIERKIYERSEFRNYPFIRFDNPARYLLLSRALLKHTINNGVYDMLRFHKGERFMNKFGPLFESYVNRGIKYACVKYDCGNKILKRQGNKSADFVIHCDNAKVFIDAKGVEMATKGMLTESSEIISQRLKTVNTGIKQCFETNYCYKTSNDNPYEAFLIIVTYKNLYLGSGADFGRLIGKNVIQKVREITEVEGHIDEENMFFIDIEELELLCEYLREEEKDLGDVLRFAREREKEPSTKKFLFKQYLWDLNKELKPPKYLNDVFEEEFTRVIGAMQK